MRLSERVRDITKRILIPAVIDERKRPRRPLELTFRLIGLPFEIYDYVQVQDALFAEPTTARGAAHESGFRPVCRVEEVGDGKARVASLGQTHVAVFCLDGNYYATTNACPHAGGPIGEGDVRDCKVTCPYHGWTFDIRTGQCTSFPDHALTTYPVRVVDGEVLVKVPA